MPARKCTLHLETCSYAFRAARRVGGVMRHRSEEGKEEYIGTTGHRFVTRSNENDKSVNNTVAILVRSS